MTRTSKIFLTLLLLLTAGASFAQSDSEELKVAALEALMAAPPDRALPIVRKVLNGNDSNEIKSRALFVLSQIDLPEAHAILGEAARSNSGELQLDAIRMIGISGHSTTVAELAAIYAAGGTELKEAVLDAYLIAGASEAVYQIALNTQDPHEFESAVQILGAMKATEQLQALRERSDMSEFLIDAYAIAGDTDSLRALAADATDPKAQLAAITALGLVGGSTIDTTLLEIYRGTDAADIKEAALDGMLISGYDEGVLVLFQESGSPEEKRQLLERLVMMDSDAVWDLIDATLSDQQ